MNLPPNHPLAARATSAAKRADPYRVEVTRKVIHPAFLVLKYPPPLNTLYGHRVVYVKGKPRAAPYKTDAHREYCDNLNVGLLVAPWPKDVELAVKVTLFRPRRVGDIDGPIKTLFDALNGRAWADDSQITDLHVSRRDDKANPRVEVSIQPAAPTERHHD